MVRKEQEVLGVMKRVSSGVEQGFRGHYICFSGEFEGLDERGEGEAETDLTRKGTRSVDASSTYHMTARIFSWRRDK